MENGKMETLKEKVKIRERKKVVQQAIKQGKTSAVPILLQMLVVIVKRGKGDMFSNFLKEKGLPKISSYGLGTADSSLQSILGLYDSEKEIVFSIIPMKDSDKLLDELEKKFLKVEQYAGIAFTIPLKSITKDSLQEITKM